MIFSPSSIKKLPEVNGVYQFLDASGTILYIGKAINIKKRVSSYFQKTATDEKHQQLVKLIYTISIIPVESEFEALVLESELIRTIKPKYNVIWKDDKHYIYIKITYEEFPTIHLARKQLKSKDTFFGPFPSSTIVREILSYLRTIFPYCTQRVNVKKACFYTHIGLCHPCPALIRKLEGNAYISAKDEYRKNVFHIKELLSGRGKRIKKELEVEMMKLSNLQAYEQAAAIRNKIEKIDYLITQFHTPEEYIDNPQQTIARWKEEQEELSIVLQKYYPTLTKILRLECYDISNVSGKFAAGSMVTFIHGSPAKQFYRKFQIRLVSKPNDFGMLSEVMRRRINHTEWGTADLFVIDGGKPQLIAILKVFEMMSIIIPVIGLAKEEEEIVVPLGDDFEKIRLPRNSPALHLLQRIRDEAHRFSHRYHEHLRLAYLLPNKKGK